MLKRNKLVFYFIILALILVVVYLLLKSDLSRRLGDNLFPTEIAEVITEDTYLPASFQVDKNIVNAKPADLVFSNNKGALRILIYEDYTNSFSAQLASNLSQLVDDFADKISLSFRPFVMPSSIESRNAALAVICANDMKKGLEMREKLWERFSIENEKFNLDLNLSDLNNFAQELNLDQAKFNACLANPSKIQALDYLQEDAKQNVILGVPTIIVVDERLDGARPYEDFIDSNGDKIEGLKTVIKRKLENN